MKSCMEQDLKWHLIDYKILLTNAFHFFLNLKGREFDVSSRDTLGSFPCTPSNIRAASNCRSSDIGWLKFAHVRWNPKCGRTWCLDKYFIVNHFTATMNKNLPWLNRTILINFGDIRPQFCFVRPRWCLGRTYVLSGEKNYLRPWIFFTICT